MSREVEEAARQLRRLHRRNRLGRDADDRQARGQHEALLAARDRDVDAPARPCRRPSTPIEETPSTNSIAGCPAASIARADRRRCRTSRPVAVSLCVASTALIAWPLSARQRRLDGRAAARPRPRARSIMLHVRARGAGTCRSSGGRTCRSRRPAPCRPATGCWRSRPPSRRCRSTGKMITSPASIFSTRFTPSTAGLNSRAKAGERWSSVGMSTGLAQRIGNVRRAGNEDGILQDIGVSSLVLGNAYNTASGGRQFF